LSINNLTNTRRTRNLQSGADLVARYPRHKLSCDPLRTGDQVHRSFEHRLNFAGVMLLHDGHAGPSAQVLDRHAIHTRPLGKGRKRPPQVVDRRRDARSLGNRREPMGNPIGLVRQTIRPREYVRMLRHRPPILDHRGHVGPHCGQLPPDNRVHGDRPILAALGEFPGFRDVHHVNRALVQVHRRPS
jgi:hypothetical protein